jgi:hypothetical protein
VNLYVAGAALGATTTAAVTAMWILGSGGSFQGSGSGAAKNSQIYDMQVSPYMARVDYQGGSSALVPISIAFRVTDKQAGETFCRDLGRVQHETKSFMQAKIGRTFSWKHVASSGLDRELTDRVNKALGSRVVERTFIAAGDQGVGDRPMSCIRLARQ